ncbi:MAG: pyrimidine-nucleoside phosphorylase [Spirochaetaceae bacterium]|jgi:pyrimidine-nucleoside phosphorylase|nr:pyrimidine-nucleoside phosphorylase [Spirochaetaceae bacterium]
MGIIEIIQKKLRRGTLSREEIDWFVENFTNGTIADYQAAALITAIYINKMNREETIQLTMAMANSGDTLDLSGIEGIKVDKHSTGGVGDKTTLIVGPIAAALGVPVAKMSGRALGFGGGTIDKLESIKNFKIELPAEQFIANVNRMKMALCAQTGVLAPADKKIYALRDVTGTVDDPSLIASSVMSKKIAGGADAIVLDVKTGSGAFMKTCDEALELAKIMVDIGRGVGKKTVALITGMDQPLGYAIGNALEVKEAIEAVQGRGAPDLMELCVTLAAYMILLAGKTATLDSAKKLALQTIAKGDAYRKLQEFVEAQGGDVSYITDPGKFPLASNVITLTSPEGGYVRSLNAERIGAVSMELGAGRIKKDDAIDYAAGIMLNKKIGDAVEKGETLAWLHTNNKEGIPKARERLLEAYTFGKAQPGTETIVRTVIT